MQTLESLLVELQQRSRYGMHLGLDEVRVALTKLGSPQEKVASVHIGGTNGKGSVCAMIESVARASGLKTGLYTSPHLCRLNERIRIEGIPIHDSLFAHVLKKALHVSDALTFFEILTVASMLAFAEENVDIAIFEVGLGGRLDATNVLRHPKAVAITSIDLDHTDVLGSTLETIAFEKAGILKEGVPCIVGPMADEVASVIESVAFERNCDPLVWCNASRPNANWVEAHFEKNAIRFDSNLRKSCYAQLGLVGNYQILNAAVSVGVIHVLEKTWPGLSLAIPKGLSSVRWPGRYERFDQDGRTVLFDCAHNEAGALALFNAVTQDTTLPQIATLLFGALADKNYKRMLQVLSPLAEKRIYTMPKGRAPASASDLCAIAAGEVVLQPQDALAQALACTPPGKTILVAGSIYLVGEIRAALLVERCDPIVAL